MAKPKPVRTYVPGEANRTSARVAKKPRAQAPAEPRAGWRAKLERRSARPVMLMSSLPGPVVPGLLLVMVMTGLLFTARWTGILLVLAGLFLSWITALAWPTTSTAGRIVRVFVNALLIALGVARLAGLLQF